MKEHSKLSVGNSSESSGCSPDPKTYLLRLPLFLMFLFGKERLHEEINQEQTQIFYLPVCELA